MVKTRTIAMHELLPGVDDDMTKTWLNFIRDTAVYIRWATHGDMKRVYVFQVGTEYISIPKKFVADPFIRTIKNNDRNVLKKILQDLLRWQGET